MNGCVMLAMAAVLVGGACVGQEPEKLGVWSAAASMNHARAAHAVVATAEAIYALAGTGDGPVLEVERFDGDAWKDETKLPGEGLNAPAAVVLNDTIYLIGGFGTVTNVPVAAVRVYDTKEKRWSECAPLPEARGGHSAAVMDGRIHVIGGGNSQSTLALHTVYDPATDRWEEKAPLPHAEGSPVAVVAGGRLYAIGGRSGRRDFGDVFAYDAAKDSWSVGPAIEARATCGAVSVGNSIFVFGGESQAKATVLPDVVRLKKGADRWESAPSMPTARSFARAVVFQGAVYVVGGSPEPQSDHAPRGLAVVEKFSIKPP